MKTYSSLLLFFILFSVQFAFSQTSSDPSEAAKIGLEKKISSESQGALKLTNFKKKDGKTTDFYGKSIYELEFEIEIEAVKSYYLNTPLLEPFVGVQGAGTDYFECTAQGEGFLIKTKLTVGQKFYLIGDATLEKWESGYKFSGYEINAHKEISKSQINGNTESSESINISTSDNMYCRVPDDHHPLNGVSPEYAKYIGDWASVNNDCFAVDYKDGNFIILPHGIYNPETHVIFWSTGPNSKKTAQVAANQIMYEDDDTKFTLKYLNDCFYVSSIKIDKPEKNTLTNQFYKIPSEIDTMTFKGFDEYKKYFGRWVAKDSSCFEIKPTGSTFRIKQGTYKNGILKVDTNYLGFSKSGYIGFNYGGVEKTIFVNQNFIHFTNSYKPSNTAANNLSGTNTNLFYDVILASKDNSKALLTIKYTDKSYFDEKIYSKAKLKQVVLAYIDSSERFNSLPDVNKSNATESYTVDLNIKVYALQNGQSKYQGYAEIEMIVKDAKSAVIRSAVKKIETGFVADYLSEKDAILAIISKIESPIYRSIWACFPINAQIVEIVETDKKGNAKTVKINAGREMGVFKSFKFRIDDNNLVNNEDSKKWQLEVVSVNEDGTSICKVTGLSEAISKQLNSGKPISVTTVYDAYE